ncbi:DUF4383 domain-containing protein [Fictibacillus fluitans]|uniref:DUF4383 domain-containing protein n=1 Tax=Fictibacillus fluitans TaxID=3058422 RepID=A0ABT8I1Y4_9BACL|nr:DUF4383 domain-containing protein [Fictibacillus sp. NE201]MDN4526986.1 DUF4383 domain-containing protein [Fictibacillus sp. NE201]
MAQLYTKVLGTVFILLAIAGFIFPMEGLFHLTAIHNLVHLASGIVAILTSGTKKMAVIYLKIAGFVYLLVGILGLFTPKFAGIHFMPADNVLHFLIALSSLAAGYVMQPSKSADTTVSQ